MIAPAEKLPMVVVGRRSLTSMPRRGGESESKSLGHWRSFRRGWGECSFVSILEVRVVELRDVVVVVVVVVVV